MKKTLVAIAALAAATGAFAQSSVTLFGTFDPSIVNSKTTYADNNAVSQTFVRNNSQGTSQISFKGVENLGGGMSAIFMYEGDFTAAAAASATNGIGNGGGEVYVGLTGGFGSFKIGAPNTPSLSVQGGRQPFGTKIGSGFGGVLGTSHVRESNSFRYDTPNMGGFSAALGYQFATPAKLGNVVAAAAVKAKSDIGLFYANGPLGVALSSYSQSGVNAQTNFNVSYAFGPAKVTFGMHNETFKALAGNTKASGSNLALDYDLTPSMKLLANVAKLNDKSAANLDRKITAIGLKYSMSKRTSLYGRFVSEKNDNIALAAAGSAVIKSVKSTVVGLQHNF